SFDAGERRLTLASAQASLTAGGRVALSGAILLGPDFKADDFAQKTALRLAFSTDDVRIAPLVRAYTPQLQQYVELSGSVSHASGTVGGTLAAPDLQARVELADV